MMRFNMIVDRILSNRLFMILLFLILFIISQTAIQFQGTYCPLLYGVVNNAIRHYIIIRHQASAISFWIIALFVPSMTCTITCTVFG